MKHSIMNLDARYTIEQTRSGDAWVAMFEGRIVCIATRKHQAQGAARQHSESNNEMKEAN